MYETDADLDQLDALLERSLRGSGPHLRVAFDQGRGLDARGLAAALQGIFEMHLATLSGSGAPLVAPVDGIFFRGRVWAGLAGASLRAKLIRKDQRVSASYNSPPTAFIVHGAAVEVGGTHPQYDAYRACMQRLYVQQYGEAWLDWHRRMEAEQPGFAGYIEPRVMFAKG